MRFRDAIDWQLGDMGRICQVMTLWTLRYKVRMQGGCVARAHARLFAWTKHSLALHPIGLFLFFLYFFSFFFSASGMRIIIFMYYYRLDKT